MPGFISVFETPTPIKFKENGCDTDFEVVVSGALYINEYKQGTFGEAPNEGHGKLKEMAVAKIAERLEHWHEGDKVLLVDGKDQLAICIDEFLKEMDINGSSRIDDVKLTDATSAAYEEQIMKPIKERKAEARRKEIEEADKPHGPLVEFSYNLSSHGMMAGTSSSTTRSVRWNKDGSVIYSTSSFGGGKSVNLQYKITPEAASKVIDLVKEEKIAALANLDIELPLVYDNFTSATIGMVFDDTSLGCDAYTLCTLNCGAAGMSFGTLEKKVSALLSEIQESGELIKNEMTETPGFGMPGMLGMLGMFDTNNPPKAQEPSLQVMGLVQADPEAGKVVPPQAKWTCQCGSSNTGRFCCDCGAPRPAGDWTCNCGSENSGKFCWNCGQPRP